MTSQNKLVISTGWDDVQVGDRTADGDVVWIKTSLGRRRLFHMGDGYQLAGSSL